MWRWLLLPLGLAAAGLAAWLVLAGPGAGPRAGPDAGAREPARRDAADGAHAPADARDGPDGAPLGEIDDASRRRLERVLEEEGAAR